MIRRNSATPALFCLAWCSRAYIAIDSKVFGILRPHNLSMCIFFWCIFSISFLKLKLCFAFETFYEITHFSYSFVLKNFKFGISQKTSNLILHHRISAPNFEASQITTLIYKFGVYVFIDAGHTEYMPAIIDIEENISVKVLIVFPVALTTSYYFGLINCQILVCINLFDYAFLFWQIIWTLAIKLVKYVTQRYWLIAFFFFIYLSAKRVQFFWS